MLCDAATTEVRHYKDIGDVSKHRSVGLDSGERHLLACEICSPT
jgi:hypothetical protein